MANSPFRERRTTPLALSILYQNLSLFVNMKKAAAPIATITAAKGIHRRKKVREDEENKAA